jgi:hypothetical protein
VSLDAQDEGKAERCAIARGQALAPRRLVLRKPVEPGRGSFGICIRSKRTGAGGVLAKLRVVGQESEPIRFRSRLHRGPHGGEEFGQRRIGTASHGGLGHPRRMIEHRLEGRHEMRGRCGVEAGEVEFGEAGDGRLRAASPGGR